MAENVKIDTQSSDDRELLNLLPSDIFPADQESVPEPKHGSSSSQDHQVSCMAEDVMLTQRSAVLSVVEAIPHHSSNPRPRLPNRLPRADWVRYDVPCISVDPLPPPGIAPLWCLLFDGSAGAFHGVLDCQTGGFWPVIVPIYTCPVYVPVQNSAGGFGRRGGVGGSLSQQNSRFSNRHVPLPRGRAGNRGGSARGNARGTGVFQPRETSPTVSILSTAANNSAEAGKRQGLTNRDSAEFVTEEENSNQQEACDRNELPDEVYNLPSEWTY